MAKYIKTEDGYKPMDEMHSQYLLKTNPTGTGSFSLNRKAGTAIGIKSHAEGNNTTASGNYSHAEGSGTTASKDYSHAEGNHTTASEYSSHAEGDSTKASGSRSHAEGSNTTASGNSSHAEGYHTTASGIYSHAEGSSTTAGGSYSHAEGNSTTASGINSHAEGSSTIASGPSSHAEGNSTTAGGSYSHAEGNSTTASGINSHAEGSSTIASGRSTHVQGEYNINQGGISTSRSTYAHIVGNGTSDSNRSNAHTLDWSGNAWFAGNIKIGGTGQNDVNAKQIATLNDIESQVASLVNSAPETLDTLNELAAALGNDSNFATTVATEIGKKVDKVDGKGLSTNDYTNEEKEKLNNISSSDWNQNDETSLDYIKNRTHYKEVIHQEKVDLLPATEIDFISLGEMGYTQSEPLNIQVGDTVKVLWGSQEYECVAQSIATVAPDGETGLPSDGVIFGNLYNTFGVDPDSQDIPFVVVANYSLSEQGVSPGCWITPLSNPTDPIITVNIFTGGDKTIYHKLDLNYLSLSDSNISKDNNAIITSKPLLNYLRANRPDWDINDGDDQRHIKNRPFYRTLWGTTHQLFDRSITLDENGIYTSQEQLYDFKDIWENLYSDMNLTVRWHDGTYNCKLRQLYAEWTTNTGENQSCNYFAFGNVSDIGGNYYDDTAPFLIYADFNPETHKTGETYIKAYDGFIGEIALLIEAEYQHWNYMQLDNRYLNTQSLQANWDEWDSSAPSFVNNKPFGRYRVSGNNHDSVPVLFELSNEGTCATSIDYLDINTRIDQYNPVHPGNLTINVNWNNEEYNCRIRYLTDEWIDDNGGSHTRSYYVFGNVSSIDSTYPDTAPFLIYANYNPQTHQPGETYVVAQDGSTGQVSCEFRYSYEYWGYGTLDNRYLDLASIVYQGGKYPVTGDAVYRAIHDAIGTALGGSY